MTLAEPYNDDAASAAAAEIRAAKVISCGMADRAATQLEAARAEIARLQRLLDKALVLAHIVGANGGMTDKDYVTEADIRRSAGIR